MAFRARMDSAGKMVDCEIFSGCRSKYTLCKSQSMKPYYTHSENEAKTLPKPRSRTYIKIYDSDSSSTPSSGKTARDTVRYVNKSMSFSELNSYTETDTSTLRCASTKSLGTMRSVPEMETETETLICETRLHQALSSSSSTNSMNTITSSSSVSAEPSEQSDPPVSCDEHDTALDKLSTTSMCSWEATYNETNNNERATVPSLQLDNCETDTQVYGMDYYQLKLERPVAEAYDNWMSAKRRQLQYKQQAARELREQQEQHAAWRRQQAEEHYKQWCEQKAQQATMMASSRQLNPVTQRRPESSREAKMRRLQLWEEQKIKQAEQRRQQQQRKQLQMEREKAARKLKSEQAWQQWLRNVAQRPKPVPLNQGMKTLRGTVSDIFINPNEWVSPLDE